MIKNYKFSNFHSYLEETVVDLTVSKRALHSYFDYETNDGSKISKVMCAFGANGSGKSNLLKPIAFVSWFVTESFRSLKPDEDIPFFPHFARTEEPTTIQVDFVIPRQFYELETADGEEVRARDTEFEYRYFLSLTDKYVVKEELKIKSSVSGLFKRVFSRELVDKKYVLKKGTDYVRAPLSIFDGCPDNCSMISYLARIKEEEHQKKVPYIILAYMQFGLSSSNLTVGGRQHEINLDIATDYFRSNNEQFEKVKDLLSKYDLGIKDIEIKSRTVLNSETGKKEDMYIPFFTHENKNEKYEVPIWLESNGTQSAYYMLAQIVQKLDSGGIAILDEFDNDLHPLLTLEILELFKCQQQNVGNAQLIFTTHTPQVLDVLRKQHCYLVEKHDSESEVWRIDDIEGIKERDNLYSKYVNGLLGGVPEFS